MGIDLEEEEEEEVAMVAEGEGGDGGGMEEQAGGGEGAQDAEGSEQGMVAVVVVCSICLDAVVAGGGVRSIVKLQCGHEFHLDCIGSAFNAKGLMQCPNCRQIDPGNWRYANGAPFSSLDVIDDWVQDEVYDVAQSETSTFLPFSLHWCPLNSLSELPSLFDEVDFTPPATFHDFMGQNFNAEPVSVQLPGATHPYLAYFQSLLPPASSSSSHVTERTVDATGYPDHWSALAGPTDGRPLQTVHPIDLHPDTWAPIPHSYSQSNNNNGVAEQRGLPVGASRTWGVNGDIQLRGSLPMFYGNSSGSRARILGVPPVAPPFIRAPGNISEHFQQIPPSFFAGSQRSGGMRALGAGGPAVPPLENAASFTLPSASQGPSPMETDDVVPSQFHAWERERFGPPYPLTLVNNEGTWWTSSQQLQQPHAIPAPAPAAAATAAPAPRRLFGQWIGTGRSPPPENRSPEDSPARPVHNPRV